MSSTWRDLFGRTGLDQNCLRSCVTPHLCVLQGCARIEKPEPDAPERVNATVLGDAVCKWKGIE
jgi:hypothetical protein